MKSKTAQKKWIIFAIALVIIIVVIGKVVLDAKQMARHDLVESHLAPLAFSVEEYRDKHGTYPESLEVLRASIDLQFRDVIAGYLQDEYRDLYGYERVSNGFSFTVTAPKSVFISWREINRRYAQGESRADFNISATAITNK